MVNTKNIAYNIQNNTVSIRYKDTVDTPLSEGKTAEELINSVKELNLPSIDKINYLKTSVAKFKSKYKIIASLRYTSDKNDNTLVLYDTIEEYDKSTYTLNIIETKYVIISDDDGTLVVEGL